MSEKIIPIWEKLALTLDEAARYSNIGINKLRELSDNPHCDFVIYIGKKRLIKRKEFEKYVSKSVELQTSVLSHDKIKVHKAFLMMERRVRI